MNFAKPVDAHAILRSSKIGLFRVEFVTEGRSRLYADEQMDDLLGVEHTITSEDRFSFFEAHIHPDDMTLFKDYVAKLSEIHTEIVYRYNHPVTGEMVVRCGGARDMAVTDCLSVIGTHQNISDIVRLEQDKIAERRLAEQNMSLRREQMRRDDYYHDLLDVQNCGLLVYTLPDHTITHINAEARRMYGVKDMAEAQKRMRELLSRAYYPDPQTLPKLKSLRDQDDAFDYECILNKGYQHECHIMAKTKALILPDGARAVVTTFLDVSDMVTLRRALQQAEEGSRAKSAFLFAMSHDLRTPMNAIIGYADLMESHWDEKEACRAYLQKLQDASRFLLALIGNVLELSRIESGKESLHEAPWDLRNLSKTLDVLLENEIEHKNLYVTQHIDLPTPFVYCDALKLREILMNLLSNAVKYTPENGHITLTLSEKATEENDRVQLCLTVEDDGMGIDESYLPHLFEAFSREKDSSESGIMGTGLGLRIVKSFVDLMSGDVHVESHPGKGSRFAVTLTLRTAKVEPQPSEKPHVPAVSLAGKRVLLTEDNLLNAEIAATILQDAGMEVETAPDGAAAIELLQNKPIGYYDLILMDIQMPRLNGYEAAKAIRALPDDRAKTPIIAMTANAFEEDRKAAFAAGMNDYAAKPIDSENLFRVIASVLHHGNDR